MTAVAPSRAGTAAGMAVIGLGTLTAPLDTAVNIAFPDITASFAIPLPMIQWVVICYVLTYASLMIAFGKLGDLIGYRTIFATGLALSAIAFLCCSLAGSYGWLLAARVLQGIGSALVLSCGPALATALYPDQQRARAIAAYTMVIALGGVIGPALGGALVAQFGWPSVFWFRLPAALLPLLLLSLLPADAPRGTAPRRFDVIGAALLVATLTAMLLALNQLQGARGNIALSIGLALAAGVAGCAFVWHERRFPEPLIRPGLFADLRFAMVNLGNVVVNLAGFTVLLLVPYFLVDLTGMTALAGGVLLAVGAIGTAALAWLAGRLLGRVPPAPLALAGGVLTAAGLLLISRWQPDTPMLALAAGLYIQGAGLGLYQVAYMEIVVATLPPGERGVAGSLAMATRTIGFVAGASLLTLLYDGHRADAVAAGLDPAMAFLAGFRGTFENATAILSAFLLASLLRRRRR